MIIAEIGGICYQNTETRHAEMQALNHAKLRGKIPNIMVVYGLDKDGIFTNGRPCMYCLKGA